MFERKKLEDWYFLISVISDRRNIITQIRNKNSLNSLPFPLSPFKAPGTLQSNIADDLKLNPYYEENTRKLDSYEDKMLILFSEFVLNELDGNYQIVFELIDTISEIYVNGNSIGKTENYFIQHTVKIPPIHLSRGKNLLTVLLSPAMSQFDKKANLPEIRDRIFVRKPAYNYGWDFAPRIVLIGIGSAYIESSRALNLKDVYIVTESFNPDEALIKVEWKTVNSYAYNFSFQIKIFDENQDEVYNKYFSQFLEVGEHIQRKSIEIQNPQLWWPNGYGKQALYRLEIKENSSGSTIYSSFGIRKVDLVLNENENDNRFIFKVNHVKIWAKGANWVPTDALTNFSTKEKYNELLMLAKKANFNMVRVWGGGVVEKEIFYEFCDKFGILIWHDFQFACSIYPEDKKYLAKVETEISGILTRLRNHPSIILWCGNNENEWIYFQHYVEDYRKEKKHGEKLHQLKKRLCQELDPSRPFWRSSPWSPTSEKSYFFDPNSQEEGNCHDWFVWHGVNQPSSKPPEYEYYASNHARFITEFGIQSFPVKSTLDKIFSKTTQKSPNDTWEFHNCNLDKIKVNLRKFGEPQNINEWILYSQAAQAFGMKFAIEIWRSRKFKTSGALIWQFNEPWPTICWSLIDYYNIPKMAYYFVKKAYEPVIAVYEFASNEITIINELTEIETDLTIKIYSIKGSCELKEQKKVKVSGNSKATVKVKRKVKEDEFLWIHLEYRGSYYDNLFLGANPGKFKFPNPNILVELEENDQILTLYSKELAFVIQLPIELEPSDNYFHLFPSHPQRISLNKLPQSKSIEIRIWNYGIKTFPIKTK